MSPRKRATKIAIAVSSSLVSEAPHLREKTRIIGEVARAAALYRVDDVHIYRDEPDEGHLIQQVLNYIETPQYLRRQLFKKRPELRYVGILPPLRTPHHPLEKRSDRLRLGEFREGIVLGEEDEDHLVDIGVDRPLRATGRAPSVGGRKTVQIMAVSPELRGRFASWRDVDIYWGFQTHTVDGGIGKLALSDSFDLKIATSKQGSLYGQVEPLIRGRWSESRRVLVAFGSPRRGLSGMLPDGLSRYFDFTVNVIPEQGCETVRTEEAVPATLAILNLLDSPSPQVLNL
jgi:predicted SPOUT superfamily RNA methylase MTH1